MNPPRVFLYLISFVTGLSVMGGEVAAGRLVAPYYGTSNIIWALIIGAVLASLALGQWLGGCVSRRRAPLPVIGWLLIVAGVLLALLPLAGRPLMHQSLDLFAQGRMATMATGALVITALLGLPMLALGAVGPVVIHAAVDHADNTGPVAGRLYALGTAGGLLGTYLSGLVLVPWLGTRATFWLCAAPLFAAGAFALLRAPSRRVLLLVVAGGPALLVLAEHGTGRSASAPDCVLEAETAYNHVRICERNGQRRLLFNEGYAVQSLYPLDGSLPLSSVWGWYAAAPAFTRGPTRAVLLLGLGGGSAARVYRHLYPAAAVTGVELDPVVVEAGRRWLGLPADVRVVVDDARAFLGRDTARYDVIIVDAFQFPYVPFHLTTVEFFRELKRHLRPGGALMLNVGRDRQAHDVVHAVARTAGVVFAFVRGADARNSSNTILVATGHPPRHDRGLRSLGLPPRVRDRLAHLPRLRPWRAPDDAPLLTDDRAPVEALTDGIVLRRILQR